MFSKTFIYILKKIKWKKNDTKNLFGKLFLEIYPKLLKTVFTQKWNDLKTMVVFERNPFLGNSFKFFSWTFQNRFTQIWNNMKTMDVIELFNVFVSKNVKKKCQKWKQHQTGSNINSCSEFHRQSLQFINSFCFLPCINTSWKLEGRYIARNRPLKI